MKRFKIFLVLFSIFASVSILFLAFAPVYAEENTESEAGEVVNENYPCKIVESISDGGDVLFDITEGNVGDTVTAYVKPDLLFSVTSVVINGNQVQLDDDGKYQFQLIDGENVVSIEFNIDNEKLEEISAIINGVKEKGIKSLFTIENLLNLLSWFLSIFMSSGFLITLIKNKKIESKTTDKLSELYSNLTKKELGLIINKFLDGTVSKILDTQTLKIDKIDECIKALARCMILSQENSPEARLAIITELTNLNDDNEVLSARIRNIVKEEQAAQEQAIIERDRALEELKKSTEEIVVISNEDGDNYGQI